MVLLTVCLLAAPAAAQQLSGVVVNARGEIRPGAVVEVVGPRKLVTRTDARGEFSVQLPKGTYAVRVRVDGRRQEFQVVIGENDVRRDFPLSW